MEIVPNQDLNKVDNTVLVCPFESKFKKELKDGK